MTITASGNRRRSQRQATVQVGSIVGVRTGSSVTRARIIEDRGNIGARGRRIVRVEVDPDPGVPGDEPLRFEHPVEWLVDAPA
ncbi:MAG: hypothetical protein ACYCVV_20520 [Acidimicrobiales bacterium]